MGVGPLIGAVGGNVAPPAGTVTLAMMASLAQSRIIGRAAGAGTGVPTALTPAQAGLVTAGTWIARQVLSAASGTYTPTAGANVVRVSMVGGGGGGAGALGGAAQSSWGGGGSSGVYFEKWINPLAAITGGAFANGAAGAAGTAAPGNGGVGGDTTIVVQGVTYTAKGGLGGIAMATGATLIAILGGGSAGGSSSGDVTTGNAPGGYGVRLSTVTGSAGNGGSCPFGAGGCAVLTEVIGNPGLGNGAGGGGGGSASVTGKAGGAGTIGLIIVDEYA